VSETNGPIAHLRSLLVARRAKLDEAEAKIGKLEQQADKLGRIGPSVLMAAADALADSMPDVFFNERTSNARVRYRTGRRNVKTGIAERIRQFFLAHDNKPAASEEIARAIDIPPSSVSTHLSSYITRGQFVRAGLAGRNRRLYAMSDAEFEFQKKVRSDS
jgi:hypothetical protein